ncbi:MAG: exo-alpha-sialidase [Verrucomicrobia bacterium]|nr:exo-alpha-sialidase [Verrucomicrobiota bacterium]
MLLIRLILIFTFVVTLPCLVADPLYDIDLTVARQGFDKKMCWVQARAGAIPGKNGDRPIAVMTLQKLLLTGSDVFFALNEMRSTDGGITWTEPKEHASFARQPFVFKGKDDLEMTVCDFTPAWHGKTGKLLGTGHTVMYENNKVMHVRPRLTPYSVYDPETQSWSKWQTLKMPPDAKFVNSGAGSVQRYDLPNGDVLLPIYYKELEGKRYSVTVLRCSFDGTELKFVEHGSELTVPIGRGLYEPSITHHKGRYFLTLRNDQAGYVAVSDDGLKFSEPRKWTFDDGELLGNYNTQQHWVSHSEALFLVYTRKGAGNDHVMRHRAPLFIARVDPDNLQVIRSSEQVLVPEKGARLGNFAVTQFSKDETWITVTEWMQTIGPKYNDPEKLMKMGADNRVWVAKVKWKTSNGEFR